MDKGENIRKLWKPSQTELLWHGTFTGMGRGVQISILYDQKYSHLKESPHFVAVMPGDGSRRPCCPGSYVHASLNYTITDQLYPAPQKLTRFVRSEGFLLLDGTQWWAESHQKARHMREQEGEALCTHCTLAAATREKLRPKNPNLLLDRLHCFVSGSPAPRIMRWLRGFLAIQ